MVRLVPLAWVLVVFSKHVAMLTLVTPPPPVPTLHHHLQGRDAITALSTCGFFNGDPSQPWVAPGGFNCRVDTLHGIWGFCPTTVIAATDCGLGGFCFDAGPCSSGCGRASLRNNPQVRTWRCPEGDDTPDAKFCSTATLIFGPDQSYDYVDCARSAGKVTYFVSPTKLEAPLSTTTTQSSTPPTTRLTASSATPQSTISPTTSATTASSTASTDPPSAAGTEPTDATNRVQGARQTDGSNSSKSSDSTNNNTGAIIGGVIGGLALVVFCVIAVVYILRHNLTRRQRVGQKAQSHSPDVDVKYPMGGWGPAELSAGSRAPAELPVNRGVPVELPV